MPEPDLPSKGRRLAVPSVERPADVSGRAEPNVQGISASKTADGLYVCPGQHYAISREVHLGRLANFFEACRRCPHRHDLEPLSQRRIAQIEAAHRHERRVAEFTREGWCGIGLNEVDAAQVRRVAAALGMLLRAQMPSRSAGRGPTVLVASDDGAEQIEWLSAVQEGLRYAGAKVVDVGAATAAGLTLAMLRLEANGGLLVCEDGAGRHRVVLRFWGPGGFAWSLPGELESLRRRSAQAVHRPARRFGPTARHMAYDDYAAHIAHDLTHLDPVVSEKDRAGFPSRDAVGTAAERRSASPRPRWRSEAASDAGMTLESQPARRTGSDGEAGQGARTSPDAEFRTGRHAPARPRVREAGITVSGVGPRSGKGPSRRPIRIAVASSCEVARHWLRRSAHTAHAEMVEVPARGEDGNAALAEPLVETWRDLREVVDPWSSAAASTTLLSDTAKKEEATDHQRLSTEPSLGPSTAVVKRLRQRVLSDRCDLGVWLGEQGETIYLLDEHAQTVPAAAVVAALLVARPAGSVWPRVAVSEDMEPAVMRLIERCGARAIAGGHTREAMSRAIWRENTLYAIGPGQRIWFRQPHGAADGVRAVLAVARLLHRRQKPLSRWIAEALATVSSGGYDQATGRRSESR